MGVNIFNIVQINPIEGFIKWGQFNADMFSIVTSGVRETIYKVFYIHIKCSIMGM